MKMKFHHIIANAKLDRIEFDARYVGSQVTQLYYDHGSLLFSGNDRNGGVISKALLFDHHAIDPNGSARILQHAVPQVMEELVRGYKLAKEAGLLGESFKHPSRVTPAFFDPPKT